MGRKRYSDDDLKFQKIRRKDGKNKRLRKRRGQSCFKPGGKNFPGNRRRL
jgi:hypothetical protein